MNLWVHNKKVYKASAGINPATGKPWQVGDTKTRPDGTKWVKTGTFSWAKAGTKDAAEAKKKTDSNGDGKKDWQEIEGQSSKDAEDIVLKYGEKGLYQLTKGGLLNFLHAHGVEDPKSMKWSEKVEKYKEIVKGLTGGHIKTQGMEAFTSEDFHILHNSDLMGDVSRLEGQTISTHSGDVVLRYTKDGHLTDETYDELIQKIRPIKGDHWGSAKTSNPTALAVALVNAPDWKPIDEMSGGMLKKYDQQLSDLNYKSALLKGIGLRKYAQEALKHPDMSRDNVPYFYRGMTVSQEQYRQLLDGDVDTIELTGCTAVSSFEEVADQYASSNWTKGFGSDRQSIKLIIERDDYMDNSIGMFHPNSGSFGHGNPNIGFELLTGSSSFYIKSVSQGKFDLNKNIDGILDDDAKWANQKKIYDSIKDKDIDSFLDSNGAYLIPTESGRRRAWSYIEAGDIVATLKAKASIADFNQKVENWKRQYLKDHVENFFKKVRVNIASIRNGDLVSQWKSDMESAWKKSDLYDEYEKYYNVEAPSRFLQPIDDPTPEDKAKIDKYYNDPKYQQWLMQQTINHPQVSPYSLGSMYDRWKRYQHKPKTISMKDFLNTNKKLEQSYKTQVDKTKDRFDSLNNQKKWINNILGRRATIWNKIAHDVQQEYGLTDGELEQICPTYNGSRSYFLPYNIPDRLGYGKRNELADYMKKIAREEPKWQAGGKFQIQDVADNPFLTEEEKKSPFANQEYSMSEHDKLRKLRINYDAAVRDNNLASKYDMDKISDGYIQSKMNEYQKESENIREKQRDYVVDSYMSKHPNTQRSERDLIIRYWWLPELEDYRKELSSSDKRYQEYENQIKNNRASYDEMSDLKVLYNRFKNKQKNANKGTMPLEVRVVCGRGKKAVTTSDEEVEDD